MFRYEKEMTAIGEQWLKSLGLDEIRREVPTPWGICDLVGCSLDPENTMKRLQYKQRRPIGPVGRISLLLHIADYETENVTSFDELLEEFSYFYDEEELSHELGMLEKYRFIAHSPMHGGYQRMNGWMPIQKRLVALELKLHRVTEVIQQACLNRGIADESWVGLPLDVAERITEKEQGQVIRQEGLGLVGLTDKKWTELIPPLNRRQETRLAKVHMAERFWRTLPKDNYS